MLASDVKEMDKKALKEAFETAMFKKDTIAIFDSEGSLPTPFYLESTSGWETRKLKPKKYYGYRYKTVSYNEEKDTLAMLNGIAFPALAMAENKDGKFAYLYASKISKNKTDYQSLQNFLQKNIYSPQHIRRSWFRGKRLGKSGFLLFLNEER